MIATAAGRANLRARREPVSRRLESRHVSWTRPRGVWPAYRARIFIASFPRPSPGESLSFLAFARVFLVFFFFLQSLGSRGAAQSSRFFFCTSFRAAKSHYGEPQCDAPILPGRPSRPRTWTRPCRLLPPRVFTALAIYGHKTKATRRLVRRPAGG